MCMYIVCYILQVVYGLCLPKASGSGDSGDHTVVIHLCGCSPQLHHVGKVNYAPSRVEGTDTTTQAVASMTTITTATTTNSWRRYMYIERQSEQTHINTYCVKGFIKSKIEVRDHPKDCSST